MTADVSPRKQGWRSGRSGSRVPRCDCMNDDPYGFRLDGRSRWVALCLTASPCSVMILGSPATGPSRGPKCSMPDRPETSEFLPFPFRPFRRAECLAFPCGRSLFFYEDPSMNSTYEIG